MPETNTYILRRHTTGSPVDTNRTFNYDTYSDDVNGPAAGGVWSAVGTPVVVSGAAVDNIPFLSLTPDAKWIRYKIIWDATWSGTSGINIFVNADEDPTHYTTHDETLEVSGFTRNIRLTEKGRIISREITGNGATGEITCSINPDGYFQAKCELEIVDVSGLRTVFYRGKVQKDDATITSITDLKLKTESGTDIDIGSTFQLYELVTG